MADIKRGEESTAPTTTTTTANMSSKKKELLSSALKRTSEWIFSQEIPSDISINVGGVSFSLHKFPLISKCGHIRKLISESSDAADLSIVELSDVPGGSEAFELAAKFCYGINFEISTENIAMLRCVAEYLLMTEDYAVGNLVGRADAYLNEVALKSPAGAVTVLHMSESFLPMAEKVKLVNRCIDAIAFIACKESQFSVSSRADGGNEGVVSSVVYHPKPVMDWWAEDLIVLRIDMFQRVMIAMMARGFKQYALGPVLMLYAQKSLRGLEIFGKGRKKIEPRQEHEKRVVLETIVSLLPREKNAMSVSFLSMLLRAAKTLETTVACQLDLEKRMGLQLAQAVLDDLLIPSYSYTGDTLLDVDTVQRIVTNYLEYEMQGSHLGYNAEDDFGSPPPTDMERVGKLMENYLAEIATDRNVSVSKFIGIAELIPEQSRETEDGMYRAIDIYLKAHPALSDMERKKVCSMMDCHAVGGLFAGVGGGSAGAAFSEFPGGKNGNGFASEEELRSDPAYIQYYYSNVNLNPRLPPPLLSKEDWRSAQRMKGGGNSVLGGIGDRRKVNRVDEASGRSLFSMPPGFNSRKQESDAESDKVRGSAEWGVDGLIGLPGLGLGNKQKSLAEIFQDDLGRAAPVSGHPSRPASRNAFDENAESVGSAESDLAHLRRDLMTSDTLRSSANGLGSSAAQSMGPPSSYSYAAALGASLSRSTTPDPQVVARAPSPCLTPIGGGRVGASEKRGFSSPSSFNAISSGMNESGDLVGAFSSMNLSANGVKDNESHLPSQIKQDVDDHQNYLFGLQGGENHARQLAYLKKSESGHMHMPSAPHSAKGSYADLGKSNGGGPDSSDRHVELKKSAVSSGNLYSKGSPTSNLNGGGGLHHQYQQVDHANSSFSNYGLSGYSMNPALASMVASQLGTGNLPPLFESAMGSPGMDSRVLGGRMASGPNLAAASNESHNLAGLGSPIAGSGLQAPFVDPMYLQYLRTSEYAAAQLAALNDPSVDRNYLGNSYMNLIELQKAYLGALLSPQKSQYGVPMGGKSGGSNHHGYYGNPAFGVGMSYPGSPPVIPNSPVGPGSPMRHNELNMCYPSGMRNLAPWHLDGGCNIDESFASSLLEEFKSNKAKSFELSEIGGHVVEFSADQYGSRFIQQKLETATTEEKNMVYQEIMPQALALMTDVFGNYVIQKFFEHGLPPQRRELANKLFSHVLTLSLQMYGCRVIQKAIEVVDLDQKIKMVEELDGHVMRCVRDQNGNHVIQKCIECVPEKAIHFIVSTFFDQVVTLSTHPYGCRVIQRVLEHCEDENTQSKVMDEILGAVSMLAQDQYGNYVVQHVLEHGKPHERSAIIKELAGKIVQMSQQKFASNVVEKCLTFGGPAERELLVNEMLGTTDENEPLQAMMKDQFANYVVQKVLETCDDQQRELILSRIKVHLNALKKYTYGKHIVARVEKLVAAGERRAAQSAQHPA